MMNQQQALRPGQLVMWFHNGRARRAHVIKTSLRQVKIRLVDGSGLEEYWISRDFVQLITD